jgi:hypothetical protein
LHRSTSADIECAALAWFAGGTHQSAQAQAVATATSAASALTVDETIEFYENNIRRCLQRTLRSAQPI